MCVCGSTFLGEVGWDGVGVQCVCGSTFLGEVGWDMVAYHMCFRGTRVAVSPTGSSVSLVRPGLPFSIDLPASLVICG